MEIFLCEILLVRVQYARVMHYTRAGNTKRAHKNTRARIIRCVDAEYSHHSSRDTRKLFAVNLVPTCVIKGDAREKRFSVNLGFFSYASSFVRVQSYTRNTRAFVRGLVQGRFKIKRTSLRFRTRSKRFSRKT
jgi:hypothetical protein